VNRLERLGLPTGTSRGTVMTGALAAWLLVCVALPARADTIDDYLARQMQQLRLPGLALAIVRDGKVETIRTYGKANLEHGVPVTPDTVFELGSLTKQFTAVAVMMLVEDGKLRLDDSIATHLPEVPEAWRGITVRHLLTHSSGLREYLSIPGLPDRAHALSHREMTRLFAGRIELEFQPGETWAYSNTGYLLLGDIIERASGHSYWEFLRARVFAPAGMHATRSSEPRAVIRDRAAGYGWSHGALEKRSPLSENAYSAGAITSTIADMTRWAIALDAGGLISTASRDRIWTPLTVRRGPVPPFSYGFGWVIDRERGHRAVFHSGGTPGFSSAIRHYPDDGVTVIVLANHGDRILDHIPLEIAGMVLPQLARREGADPDARRSERLAQVLRAVIAGNADSREFTPAMQLFLSTATARGLGEWIASHGELKSLRLVQTEDAGTHTVQRCRAVVGDARLWFSFTLTAKNEIAQIYWW
jgi:CubicO group peptidase (beta-lactamase class C family)